MIVVLEEIEWLRLATVLGDSLYFRVTLTGPSSQLWRLDASGMAAAVTDGGLNTLRVTQLRLSGGKLFFNATGGDSIAHLWQTDGTPGGTMETAGVPTSPTQLTSDGDRLFFVASDTAHGSELWTTAGTPATTRVFDIYPGTVGSGPASLFANGGFVYFHAEDGTQVARELWRSCVRDAL